MARPDGSIVIDTKILTAGWSKGLGGMKTMAVTSAAAIGAAAIAAGAAFVKLASAAEDAAVSDKRIASITKTMELFGKDTGKVTQRILDYASATSLSIGVDDDSIKATQAKLLTFKQLASTADDAGGAFDRATKAAYDMAAAGFGQAEQNAVQLGKALEDPVKGITALTRSGITFTKAEKERIKTLVESGKMGEAQNLVLKAIEKQVGGTAEATAKASDKMKVAFGEMEEALGQRLLPAFEKVSDGLTRMLSGDKTGAAVFAEGLAEGFSQMASLIPVVLPPLIQGVTQILLALTNALPSIITSVTPAMVDGLSQLLLVLAQVLPVVLPQLTDAIVLLITSLANTLGVMAPKLIPPILLALNKMSEVLIDHAPEFGEAALVLIGGMAVGIFKGMGRILARWPDFLRKMTKPLTDKVREWTTAGGQLVSGIWNGITDKFGWLVARLKTFASNVTDKLKAFFHIKSPSKLFEREIGVNLALGIGSGFSKASGSVFKGMVATVSAEMGRFASVAVPGGAVSSYTDNRRSIVFNGRVRTYPEMIRAERDIERGLAF